MGDMPEVERLVAPILFWIAESEGVNVVFLATPLKDMLERAARVHVALFGSPLVVTSGNDGQHMAHSKHYSNEAIDLRSRDLNPTERDVFQWALGYLAKQHGARVVDETQTASPHWHVETA